MTQSEGFETTHEDAVGNDKSHEHRELMTLANATTAVTDTAITRAGSSLAVTANAEQIPNICTITGLFLERGPKRISLFFFDNMVIYSLN